jgi:hypothetical protein
VFAFCFLELEPPDVAVGFGFRQMVEVERNLALALLTQDPDEFALFVGCLWIGHP